MHTHIEIGNFKDLEILVDLLNHAFKEMHYRLEPIEAQKGMYLFIEDPLQEDAYECGLVEKRGRKAFAYSSDVHALILGAYGKYLKKSPEC